MSGKKGNTRTKPRSKLRAADIKSEIAYLVMLAPFFILFFIFFVLPVLSSAVLSLFHYDTISAPSFVGWENFLRMFMDDEAFPTVLKNTLFFAIVTGPAGFVMSFFMAWCINEFPRGVRTLLSFLFYSPTLAGGGYVFWKILFSGDSYGYLNSLLLSFGLITEPTQWLKDPRYITAIVLIVQLWASLGTSFLANMAGLQNISEDMYEAGAIDGIRNRWQDLWYITLPSMKSMLLFSAVMQIAASYSVGAVAKEMAGYPSVNNTVDTIITHLGEVGTVRYEYGYAAAISVFLFALMALTRFLIDRLLNAAGR